MVPRENPTICANCQYYHKVTGPDKWFNHVCKAEPQPVGKMNFVTGIMPKIEPVYCNARNAEGNCQYFKAEKKERKYSLKLRGRKRAKKKAMRFVDEQQQN